MGEIAHVDLDRLLALADGFRACAAEVADMHPPGLEPEALPGSAVSEAVAAAPLPGQLDDVVASLNGWAAAARASAEAFQYADDANGRRFAPR